MGSKRRPEISLLNVFFCLTVIFIHVISYAVSRFTPGTVQYTAVMLPWRLATFVVQGFVMLSGVKLFLNNKDSKPYLKHIKSRVFGVIVPYAICYAVYYVYFMITYDYPLDIVFMLKHFICGSLVYHLYFIPIIFQFDLLFPLWRKIVNKCSPVIVLPFVIVTTLMCEMYLPEFISAVFPGATVVYNDRLFTTYLSFWLIGCYIGKYYDEFCAVLKKNFRTLCVIFGFVLVVITYSNYLAFNNLASMPYLNIIHYLYVMYVCMFLYAVALKIPENVIQKIPLIKIVDRYSLYIYLYHVLIILIVTQFLL